MVNICERPPEANDRAVPGQWEGELLIGRRNATAIATLVERATGYAMLVHLPSGYKPQHVAPALARKVQTPPDALGRSLTWARRCATDARLEADPRRCRHRCVLLRPARPLAARNQREHQRPAAQYFPKGTEFSAVTEGQLDAIADELNERPRKRFGFATPTEHLAELLLQ
jgi:IS30 family transposase